MMRVNSIFSIQQAVFPFLLAVWALILSAVSPGYGQMMSSREAAIGLIDSARRNISLEPELGIEYAKRALESGYSIKDDSITAAALHEIGKGYYFQNNYAAALEYWRMALSIREGTGDKRGAVATMNNIGIVYFEISKYEQALDYYFKALKIKEELGDKKAIANTLNNIGSVYDKLEEKELALDYFDKSMQINDELKDMGGISVNLNNIGSIYRDAKRWEEALQCYQRALEANEKLQDKLGVSIVLNNMGELYYDKGDNKKAMDYYFRSLVLKEQLEDRRGIANLANNLGRLFFNNRDYKRSEQFLKRGQEIALEVGAKDYLKDSYHYLYLLNKERGDFKTALVYNEKLGKLKDDMYKERVSRQIAEMQAVYQLEKKDKEIAQLAAEKAKTISTLTTMMVIIIGAGAVIALLLVFYYFNKKTSRLLAEKNKQLENAVRLLKRSENKLREAIADKDRFLSIISHDLRNPLTTLLGTSGYLTKEWGNMAETELERRLRSLRKAVLQLQNLLDNLLDWSQSQLGNISVQPAVFILKTAVEENLDLFNFCAEEKGITLRLDGEDDLQVECDRKIFDTVMRNLLSNAIKFTGKGGTVTVYTEVRDAEAVISVEDTGIGLEVETAGKINQGGEVSSLPGTDKEKGTGLGLKLCRDFAARNQGNLWVESELGKGTRFSFSVKRRIEGQKDVKSV